MPLPRTRRSAIGERLRNRAGVPLTRRARRGPPRPRDPSTRRTTLSISRARPTFAATASTTSPSSVVARFERPRVPHLGVLERHERLVADDRPHPRLDRRASCARRRPRPSRRPASACGQHPRGGPLVVARGTRSGSTSRPRRPRGRAGSPRTSTGQVEIGGHLPDHRELLEVLAAEERDRRADDREQLGHDGGDAVEVHRPGRAAQPFGEPGHVHDRARRRRSGTSPRPAGRTGRRRPPPRRPRRRRRGRAGTRRGLRSARTASGSRTASRRRRPSRSRAARISDRWPSWK